MDVLIRQTSSNTKELKRKSKRHTVNKADTKKAKQNPKLIQRQLQCSRNIVSSASCQAPGAMALLLLLYSLCSEVVGVLL